MADNLLPLIAALCTSGVDNLNQESCCEYFADAEPVDTLTFCKIFLLIPVGDTREHQSFDIGNVIPRQMRGGCVGQTEMGAIIKIIGVNVNALMILVLCVWERERNVLIYALASDQHVVHMVFFIWQIQINKKKNMKSKQTIA